MFTVEHEIEIAADAQDVWRGLTDFDAYPEWNPYVLRLDGEPGAGQRIRVTIQQDNWRRPLSFRATLSTFIPERELGWRGVALIRGVHDTHHFFRLDDLGPSRTRLHHAEEFSGFLPRLIYSDESREHTRSAFRTMNQALATHVAHRIE